MHFLKVVGDFSEAKYFHYSLVTQKVLSFVPIEWPEHSTYPRFLTGCGRPFDLLPSFLWILENHIYLGTWFVRGMFRIFVFWYKPGTSDSSSDTVVGTVAWPHTQKQLSLCQVHFCICHHHPKHTHHFCSISYVLVCSVEEVATEFQWVTERQGRHHLLTAQGPGLLFKWTFAGFLSLDHVLWVMYLMAKISWEESLLSETPAMTQNPQGESGDWA